MPRGHKYSEEMRAEARRLRREGWSLDEIAKKLGPPKNTLIGWVGGIELTPAQLERIAEKEKQSLVLTQGLGGAYHRQARLDRIKLEQDNIVDPLSSTADPTIIRGFRAATQAETIDSGAGMEEG